MNILLAVTGSISCYKAYDLARGLVNVGHEVKVILTKGALEFIKPQTFRYLGCSGVFTHDDDFNYPKAESDDPVLHVSLARWAEKLVIAPLSANTCSRLSRGEASDLLTSVFLAFEQDKNILVFPAMNTQMLAHPFTQENLNELKKIKSLNNVYVHPTSEGVLACNEQGSGKLPSIEEMLDLIYTIDATPIKKNALIATGATLAPIDPVRYVTNPSSGVTGYYLAKECLKKGYDVLVVAGKYATDKLKLLKNHPGFQLITITTTREMYQVIDFEFDQTDLYITPAAISDLEFDMFDSKIKKDKLDHTIQFNRSVDILGEMVKKKKSHQKIVGFAAETNLSLEVLKEKFDRKPVDLLVGTKVFHDSKMTQGFQNSGADYKLYDGKEVVEARLEKDELAKDIISRVTL